MRRPAGLALRLLVSAALVAAFAVWIDLRSALRPIPRSGWPAIAIMFLVANLDRWVMSYKWRILLRAKAIDVPFAAILRGYYVGTFWGVFLPTSLGGDAVRAFGVAGRSDRARDVVSSIVLERVLGLVATFLVAIASLFALAALAGSSEWRVAALALVAPFAIVVGAVLLSFQGGFTARFARRLGLRREGIAGAIAELHDSYRAYRHHRGAIARFLLWSIAEQYVPVVCVLLVARALDWRLPAVAFAVLVPIIMALSKLPVSLDGFGVREGLYAYFFSFLGVPAADAFRLGLVSHVLAIASLLPMFFYCSFWLRPASRAAGSTAEKGACRRRSAIP